LRKHCVGYRKKQRSKGAGELGKLGELGEIGKYFYLSLPLPSLHPLLVSYWLTIMRICANMSSGC
jgi:hypothetical protein